MSEKVYEGLWRAKWTTDGAKTLEEAAQKLEESAAYLRELARDGCELRDEVVDDYGFFITTDPNIAKKYELCEVENEDDEGDDEEVEEVGDPPTS